MKLKIVSDGTPMGTFVMDEDGNRVEGVTEIEWNIGVDRVGKCRLAFNLAAIEVETKVEETAQLEDKHSSFRKSDAK